MHTLLAAGLNGGVQGLVGVNLIQQLRRGGVIPEGVDEAVHMVTDDLDSKISALQDQALGLAQRIRELVSENARISRDQTEFQSEYEPLSRRYEELTKRIAAAQKEKADKEMRAKRISLFMRLLKDQGECMEFDPVLFTAFVEKVIVQGSKKDAVLTFVMRDGSEHTTAVNPKRISLAQ